MKLYIKRKLLSLFESYNVLDEHNNVVYKIKWHIALRHQLRIFNANNVQVGFIEKKIISLLPSYILYDEQGHKTGFINKRLSLLRPKYILKYNNWKITGNILELNFRVTDSNNLIMIVRKKIFHLVDCYEIEIPNEEYLLLSLMIVLAINTDKHDKEAKDKK